ncbi:hypothetical protein PMAYCL1PPCAC_16566, partial [Pristionchus mayeri]
DSDRFQQWEKFYNIVHISMICIIPYVLELILYSLILSLLSEAQNGEFTGFRRFIHERIVRFFHIKRRKEIESEDGRRMNLLSPIAEDTDTPSPAWKMNTRRVSLSADSSPRHALIASYQHRFYTRTTGMRRMTIAVDANGTSTVRE